METINERIKLLRKDNDLTQKQFADRILVTQSYLSRIESGKEVPNDKLIKLIALEFNVPTGWLEKGIGSQVIDKSSYDYFDRGYSRELQEGLEEEIRELMDYLHKQNDGIVSTNIQGILLEMRNFLDAFEITDKSIHTIVFEKITGVIMELFVQLSELSGDTKRESFNSIAWLCTSTLTEALNDIRELYFNSDNLRY